MVAGAPDAKAKAGGSKESRAARDGAIGAVAGALVGAVTAGFFGYLIAHDQNQSQAAQAQTDFLRTQRESIYAGLIADALTLQTEESGCSAEFANRDSLPQLAACAHEVEALLPKVFSGQDAAEIIGTASTGTAANKLGTDLATGEGAVVAAYQRAAKHEQVVLPVLSPTLLHQIVSDRLGVIGGARRELGVKG